MARKPTGKPVGPPLKEINWELFEQLCVIQCTQSEIASMLKVHSDTLSDRSKLNYGEDYSSVYKRFSESGKCSLRREQRVLAKKNAAMAIWLGKHWLGQWDKNPNEHLPPNDSNIDLAIDLIKENQVLKKKLALLEDRSIANQCKTDTEHNRGNAPI